MKIALTADLHLTTFERNPERYHALQNILDQMRDIGIRRLIMAGDTFDESSRNYAEFENFCRRPENCDIQFVLIPGNHDFGIESSSVVVDNLEIVAEPRILIVEENGLPFFLLPYFPDKTMGEFIAAHVRDLPARKWVLIAHGDWTEGSYEPSPTEPGVYMPLTRSDLDNYAPAVALLGHIHKQMDGNIVHYLGSPCGLDIRETGRRRFIVLDTESLAIESRIVLTDYIYFSETFVVLPVEDELGRLKNQIEQRIASWLSTDDERQKVRLQIKVKGYAFDKRKVQQAVEEGFAGFKFYRDWEPDFDQVFLADDPNLAEIARRAEEKIAAIELSSHLPGPAKEEILLQALHVIYK